MQRNGVSMLEQWQCSQHHMRTMRRRIYAAHLTVYRGIIEQLEQVEIDAFPTALVTNVTCSQQNPGLHCELRYEILGRLFIKVDV